MMTVPASTARIEVNSPVATKNAALAGLGLPPAFIAEGNRSAAGHLLSDEFIVKDGGLCCLSASAHSAGKNPGAIDFSDPMVQGQETTPGKCSKAFLSAFRTGSNFFGKHALIFQRRRTFAASWA